MMGSKPVPWENFNVTLSERKKTYFTFGKSPPAASRLENLTKTLPTVKNTIRGLMESFVWTSRFQGGRWSGEGVSVSEQVTQGVTHSWRTWETCDVKLRTTRKTMYEKVIKCIQMYYNRWHWGWPTVDGHGKHGMRTTRKTLRTTFYLIITSRRQWEWVWGGLMNEGSKGKEDWRLTVPLFPLHTDFTEDSILKSKECPLCMQGRTRDHPNMCGRTEWLRR